MSATKVRTIFLRKLTTIWRRYIYRSVSVDEHMKKVITRWELDYSLSDVERLSFLDEYLEIGEQLRNNAAGQTSVTTSRLLPQ